MAIEIKDRNAPVLDLPKEKTVVIGDVATGELTPQLERDRLTWRACIRPKSHPDILCDLMQASGPSPHEAVAAAILSQRRKVRAMSAILVEIERECGTSSMGDEELAEKIRGL